MNMIDMSLCTPIINLAPPLLSVVEVHIAQRSLWIPPPAGHRQFVDRRARDMLAVISPGESRWDIHGEYYGYPKKMEGKYYST